MKLSLRNLRCEYLRDPLGIDELQPRLSWEIKASGKNVMQTAYRILVADSEEALAKDQGNLWDSGEVKSSQSNQIEYAGKQLKVFQFCYWKVMVSDNRGNVSAWSKIANWSMGHLSLKDWRGKWISYPVGAVHNSPYFRKEFQVTKKIKRATLYATAKGLYEAYINGKKISGDVFTPGWTDYGKRIYYNTYDVTNQLKKGKNFIGSILGEGWYKGPIGWEGKMQCYGGHTQFLANLKIEYADGSSAAINTDETWKTTLGPILQSTFLWGENYDARQELGDWSKAGYNESKWQEAKTSDLAGTDLLQAYPCETVKKTEVLPTIDMWQTTPGSWVFDLGQNFAGIAKLRVKAKAGTIIRMRFGEMVNPDKTLYVENLRGAYSTDTYISKGKGIEIWEPRFTFHGFRYVEVTGLTSKPDKNTVTGIVLGSATTRVGHFACNDPMINQLYSNLVWTQRANFLEIPTDCPQRDERLGWTGDAQVYIRTAISNMDVAAFFKKWLIDLEDTQQEDGAVANVAPAAIAISKADAAWGDAITICPWTVYECYGDTRILKKHYPAMKKWLAYLESTADKLIRSKTHCFGDWLSINADTPKEVIQTAYFAYSAKLTANTARVLKKYADAKKYDKLSDDIKKAFCKKFVKKNGRVHGDTQTAYVLALHFDLLPEDLRPLAVKYLVADIKAKKGHQSTGFVGTAYLMHVLTRFGHIDIAYKLLLNKTYPSWLYSVVNGATTIWERWNGWKKGEGCGDANMNSFSHYAYGAVGEWMFKNIAGIDLESPGFKEIVIAPKPGKGINQANVEYNSIYGKISSSWTLQKGALQLDVSIPPNTMAEVIIPCGKQGQITESGKEIKQAEGVRVTAKDNNRLTCEIGSGKYSFVAK